MTLASVLFLEVARDRGVPDDSCPLRREVSRTASGKSSKVIGPEVRRATARSMALRNSRTFPGQVWVCSAAIASWVTPLMSRCTRFSK